MAKKTNSADQSAMPYDSDYYESISAQAERSAKSLLPVVTGLLAPQSVVDVGCGTGGWLRAFSNIGVHDYLGIDSDFVPEEDLRIPEERFIRHDLTQPLSIDRRFDLVMSLEVAEHLPEEFAHQFVQLLTSLGDLVLFSAAIPHQEGTNHLNPQWPDYWEAIFNGLGYQAVDAIRAKIWNDDRIDFWYRQNTIFFMNSSRSINYEKLIAAAELPHGPTLRLVHPEMYKVLHERWVRQSQAYEVDTRFNRFVAGLLPNPVRSRIRSIIQRLP